MPRKHLYTLALFILSFIGIGFTVLNLSKKIEQSDEGRIMVNVCEDINAYKTFRVVEDFEEIIHIISTRIVAENDRLLYDQTIEQLQLLEIEAIFRTHDQDL